MQQIVNLFTATPVVGAMVPVYLNRLPPGKMVKRILLWCSLTGTKDCADTLDGAEAPLAIANVRLGNMIDLPGYNLYEFNKHVYGRRFQDPTDLAASATTWTLAFGLEIPFHDPRQPGASDGAIPSELLNNRTLELTFAGSAPFSDSTVLFTGGTIYVTAELCDGRAVPQINQIGYLDPGTSEAKLDPGIYKDLLSFDGAGIGTVTTAEQTTISVSVDGNPVLENTRHESLVQAHATEYLDEATEVVQNAARYLPVIWTPRAKGNISKQPAAEDRLIFRITSGTETAPRLVYWRTTLKGPEQIQGVLAATGLPPGAEEYEPQLAAKSSLDSKKAGRKERLLAAALPGKVRQRFGGGGNGQGRGRARRRFRR